MDDRVDGSPGVLCRYAAGDCYRGIRRGAMRSGRSSMAEGRSGSRRHDRSVRRPRPREPAQAGAGKR